MSANPATTTPLGTAAPAAPAVNLSVTEPAAGEIKKPTTVLDREFAVSLRDI